MSGSPPPPVRTIPVAPTQTDLLELDVRDRTLVSVQVTNLDPAQSFDGSIWSRQAPEMAWAPSTLSDLLGIPGTGSAPNNSRAVDIDVSGKGWLLITGVMSGAGGDVAICARTGGREK